MSYKEIESVHNQTIVELAKLKEKKARDQTHTFLVEGIHLVEEAMQAGLLKGVFLRKDLPYNPDLFQVPVVLCSQNVLNKLSVQKSDARLVGLVRMKKETKEISGRTLLLDCLQDPGNVGTLIRSAYAFGVDRVVLGPGCADPYNPKTIQSSQGALFHIALEHAPLAETIENLQQEKIPVYAAALSEQALDLKEVCAGETYGILIGNEGKGIQKELLDICQYTVKIEMSHFESLNAAIAGSILMYWFQIGN